MPELPPIDFEPVDVDFRNVVSLKAMREQREREAERAMPTPSRRYLRPEPPEAA